MGCERVKVTIESINKDGWVIQKDNLFININDFMIITIGEYEYQIDAKGKIIKNIIPKEK